MTYPRFLRVLAEPATVFDEAATRQTGIRVLCLLLAVEFVFAQTTTLTSDLLRIFGAPINTLQAVWSGYASYATGPLFLALLGGVILYLMRRANPASRLDILAGTSLFCYAWTPHTLVVLLGSLLRSLGVSVAVLPPNPVDFDAPIWLRLARWALEYGGTAVLCVIALTQARRPQSRPRAPNTRMAGITLAICLLVASAAGAGVHYLRENWQQVRPLVVGDRLPAFTATGLNLPDVSSEALHGQVILMDFWATWCPPCVASMPHLQELHRRFGQRGFKLLAINTEAGANTSVTKFIEANKLQDLPVYMDTGALLEQFHVHIFPTSFLVDSQGIVRGVYQGSPNAEALTATIESMLPKP